MDKNLGYEVISENLQSKLEIVRPEFFFSLMQKKLIFFGFFLNSFENLLTRPQLIGF